ncbi:hypothetical protein [Paenibacillus massiliensis]|uniref:hypothetical protein n=1 Tax=Paenibacillus massiliensis TaxID=225917 RepID=UPI0003FC70C3|nr:hypothetical protein [Paenibacillus massiliensis]
MISEEELDALRVAGSKVRVIRDGVKANDVVGTVLAWDDQDILIRRPNRNVARVPRTYTVQLFSEPRPEMIELNQGES